MNAKIVAFVACLIGLLVGLVLGIWISQSPKEKSLIVTGNVADLPDLNYFNVNSVVGDISDLPDSLKCINLHATSVTGNISDIPPTLHQDYLDYIRIRDEKTF